MKKNFRITLFNSCFLFLLSLTRFHFSFLSLCFLIISSFFDFFCASFSNLASCLFNLFTIFSDSASIVSGFLYLCEFVAITAKLGEGAISLFRLFVVIGCLGQYMMFSTATSGFRVSILAEVPGKTMRLSEVLVL